MAGNCNFPGCSRETWKEDYCYLHTVLVNRLVSLMLYLAKEEGIQITRRRILTYLDSDFLRTIFLLRASDIEREHYMSRLMVRGVSPKQFARLSGRNIRSVYTWYTRDGMGRYKSKRELSAPTRLALKNVIILNEMMTLTDAAQALQVKRRTLKHLVYKSRISAHYHYLGGNMAFFWRGELPELAKVVPTLVGEYPWRGRQE